MDLDDAIEAQVGLTPADAMTDVMAYLPAPPENLNVMEMTAEERRDLARSRAVLDKVERAIRARREAIDLAFRRAGAARRLDQVKVAGGTVRLTPAKSRYETKGNAMRDRLLSLMHEEGNVTQEEIDEALPMVITVKPNHTKLNYLARHRGEAVEGAIEEYRSKVDPDPLAAKVEYHLQGGVK